MKRILAAFTFLLLCAPSYTLMAQNDDEIDSTVADGEDKPVPPEPDGKYKFGVKIGLLGSTITGKENDNNTLRFGLGGGVYVRKKFKNEKWGYQAEFNISLRGSNYRATDSTYATITLGYIDVPLYLFFNVSKDQNHKILIGPQFSYLINASLYKNKQNVSEPDPPKLIKHDVLGCLGYHYRLGHVAIQTTLKYGFVNINDGLLPNITPKNQGKSMHNLFFEINLLF